MKEFHGLSWITQDPLRLQGFEALIPDSSPAGRLLLSWTVAVSEPKAKRPCTGSHALVIERPKPSSTAEFTSDDLVAALTEPSSRGSSSTATATHVLSSHFGAPSILQIPNPSHLNRRPCKPRLRLKATVGVRHRFHECAELYNSVAILTVSRGLTSRHPHS